METSVKREIDEILPEQDKQNGPKRRRLRGKVKVEVVEESGC